MRCVMCHRPLKDSKSIARGFGRVCAKKAEDELDDHTRELIKDVIAEGYEPQVITRGVVQMGIPDTEERDDK